MLTADRPAPPRQPRTLWRLLAVHIFATTLAISTLLVAFFVAKYMLDTPRLRRATLEAQSLAITAALREGRDPAASPLFRDYKDHYAFRVFEHHRIGQRRVVSEVNTALLPQLGGDGDSDLAEGFIALEREDKDGEPDRWLLTDRDEAAGRVYWLQVVMVGDPAWRWRGVIFGELFDHVFVPMISIVPLITLTTLLSVRHALRQLGRLGARAQALGAAASRGQPLRPLPDADLPFELHALVGAINTMLAALNRVLAAQREFAADAAHELRTPLALMALQVSDLPHSAAREQLARGLADMGRLIGQLLRLSQVESAMLSAQQRTNLGAIGRKICLEMAGRAIERHQCINFDAPAQPVWLQGNAELIEIALRNIIDNALKVSPPAATVDVRVTVDQTITVDDEGPGIPLHKRQLIFRRFWRDESVSAKGVGVGLALVRKIADLHGGSVTVEDRQPGGSRFILDFSPKCGIASAPGQSAGG